jgi:hypothetical protein
MIFENFPADVPGAGSRVRPASAEKGFSDIKQQSKTVVYQKFCSGVPLEGLTSGGQSLQPKTR